LYFNSFATYAKLGQPVENTAASNKAAVAAGSGSVRLVQGHVTAVDLEKQVVMVTTACLDTPGDTTTQPHQAKARVAEVPYSYDVLLIASGVSSGFWKTTKVQSEAEIKLEIQQDHEQIRNASTVAVVGSGPSGVSAAYSVKRRFPDTSVHLFVSREQVLPHYHPRVRAYVHRKLAAAGVILHCNRRVKVPTGKKADSLTTEPIHFENEASPTFQADVVVWTIGRVAPNNSFIPPTLLSKDGYVNTDPYLRAVGCTNVFAVGDIANTDLLRTSARNDGWMLVASNIKAHLAGKQLTKFKGPRYKWGSVLGVWDGNGMELFLPIGWPVLWIPQLCWEWLWPLAWCAFSDRNLHSRMSLGHTHVRLK
jgi:NADH dehydrogenase FAD-containing subunit